MAKSSLELGGVGSCRTRTAVGSIRTGSNWQQASGILVNFTPRLQLRGGVERTPGFMCSESWDAVRAVKTSWFLLFSLLHSAVIIIGAVDGQT